MQGIQKNETQTQLNWQNPSKQKYELDGKPGEGQGEIQGKKTQDKKRQRGGSKKNQNETGGPVRNGREEKT